MHLILGPGSTAAPAEVQERLYNRKNVRSALAPREQVCSQCSPPPQPPARCQKRLIHSYIKEKDGHDKLLEALKCNFIKGVFKPGAQFYLPLGHILLATWAYLLATWAHYTCYLGPFG